MVEIEEMLIKKHTEVVITPALYFEKKEEINETKISLPIAGGGKEKDQILNFDANTSKESYLEMLNEFSVLLELYELMQARLRAYCKHSQRFQELLKKSSEGQNFTIF